MTERDDHDSASVHLSAEQAENLAHAFEAALNSTDRQDAKIDYARASAILAAELERLEKERPLLAVPATAPQNTVTERAEALLDRAADIMARAGFSEADQNTVMQEFYAVIEEATGGWLKRNQTPRGQAAASLTNYKRPDSLARSHETRQTIRG
jgi:hypothetical protein